MNKSIPVLTEKARTTVSVLPNGDGNLPRGYIPFGELGLENLKRPVDGRTGKEVGGRWEPVLGANPSLFIPLGMNRVNVKIVFIPDNKALYSSIETLLEVDVEDMPRKFSFSGTRGKWFL